MRLQWSASKGLYRGLRLYQETMQQSCGLLGGNCLPVAGHGSKGVYRGSKLTRRVFENILDEDYIAQTFVLQERSLKVMTSATRKVDIRFIRMAENCYYLLRVYQGQVTNFRTPGGDSRLSFRCDRLGLI